jgi:cytochrome c peroxidase
LKRWTLHILILVIFIITSCSNESVEVYIATPSSLNIPQLFENKILNPVIPIDNPQTVEGIALGKKLFFDPILSADNSQACADCHAPENAFSDSDRFSDGIDGSLGNRNSMPLFNLAWNYDEKFFWDGNTFSLEHQAFIPVTDPTEMASNWARDPWTGKIAITWPMRRK